MGKRGAGWGLRFPAMDTPAPGISHSIRVIEIGPVGLGCGSEPAQKGRAGKVLVGGPVLGSEGSGMVA